MRRFLGALLLACLGACLPGRAQDLIQRRGTTRIEALVLEVRGSQIFYKKWAAQDGPTSVISTAHVQHIQYRSGKRQEFPQPAATSVSVLPPPPAEKPVNRAPNILSIRPGDLLFANITLTYERLLGADSQVGVKVPLTLGVEHSSPRGGLGNHYQRHKTFSTGLEINFYPGPRERFRYFIGPALQYGRFRYQYAEEYLGELDFFGLNLGKVYGNYQESIGQHVAVLLNNGVWYQLGKRFVFTADGGVGWQTKILDKTRKNFATGDLAGSRLKVSGNFNVGYQF
ncbi:hypothetical protein BEN47_16350 [Hymenobacter lapidarius]|uniref:DUF3575 domain-containing protein n=2 Tax=Hymenobacter lapidarius TaxID=1908237 RepID=A0A1G1T0R5_9BACT|nr:hypothetical protein BEN47_16350 [Hymenobacter lapidarius]